MKLRKLEIQGFMSFVQPTTIEFREGVTYVLGDNQDDRRNAASNGSGKTTVLNAVSWALFGEAPGGISKDGTVPNLSDMAKVELLCTDLHVVRVKPRKKSEILRFRGRDGVWREGSLADTQTLLLEELGMGASTFYNTVYFSAGSASRQFLHAKPAERARDMAAIIDDSVFQTAGRLVAGQIDSINADLKGHDTLLRELDYQEGKLKETRKRVDGELQTALSENTSRKNRVLREISATKKLIAEEMENFVDTTTYSLKELYEKKQDIRKKIDKVTGELGSVTGRLTSIRRLTPGELCPVCEREIDTDCAEGSAATRTQLQDSRRNLATLQGTLEAQLEKVEKWIEQVKRQEKSKETSLAKIEGYKAEIRLLEDRLDETPDVKLLEQSLKEVTMELNEIEQRRTAIMVERDSFNDELPLLKELKKIFQQDVRNILLDRVREGLKYYTMKYLSYVNEGIGIDFPSTTHTGAEKFEIAVRMNGKVQPLENYSGGESWKLALSMFLGLRRVLLGQLEVEPEFLFIDDPVGPVDEKGFERFLEMLEVIKEEFPQILVTCPIDVDRAGHILKVTKYKERSTCVYE